VKSGRAVLFPVYKSTYERGDGYEVDIADETNAYRDHVVLWFTDFRRSVGLPGDPRRYGHQPARLLWPGRGGAMRGIVPAVAPRIRTIILAGSYAGPVR